jgi:hypothetical protein
MTTRGSVPRADSEGTIGTAVKRWLTGFFVTLTAGTVDATTYKVGGVAKTFVTNGDSHDHVGGDGAQVDHGGLGGLADDDHSQYVKADGTRAFTGAEAGLTPAADTNTTQIATTAFVCGQAGAATPVGEGTGTVGISLRFSRQDHIHPSRVGIARLDGNVTTTSTTAANITGLSFSIAANETVQFEAWLNNGNSGTTGNKFAVNFPSGATLNCTFEGSTSGPTAVTQSKITAAATLAAEIYHLLASQVGRTSIMGTIKNGATPGTIQLQFAAVTSGTVTINAGSYLQWARLASATAY